MTVAGVAGGGYCRCRSCSAPRVYLVALVTLIVFCCLPTQEYPNRYGPPPGLGVG